MHFTRAIIPAQVQIVPSAVSGKVNSAAISAFATTGFFLERDTWWEGQVALPPATEYELDVAGTIVAEKSSWRWHYSPRDITLKQATEEFAHLFERITQEQLGNQKVILPLSGGLDSRTQAAALRGRKEVSAFSYEFPDGLPETRYGRAIARAMGFNFQAFTVPRGYLWDKIERLADINGCFAEFTHPRQMAFIDAYPTMGDIFFLGHWGDVLFDDMGVPDDLPFEKQVETLLKKIIKKGGMELGTALWEAWGLEGRFEDYLRARTEQLLGAIDIDNANARIRAFKSLYWAPRWTSVNLQIFAAARPIALPYYHDDMCRFICTVPERHLAGRQIQIEYLKMVAPELARIPWQAHRPFNLYSFRWNRSPWNLPIRIADKARRSLSSLSGNALIQRNWELQFLGEENDRQLRDHLFNNNLFKELVPTTLVEDFYKKFKEVDPVYYSHPISMLLTLSVFSRKFWKIPSK
jgi:hypothetical protein